MSIKNYLIGPVFAQKFLCMLSNVNVSNILKIVLADSTTEYHFSYGSYIQ